MHTQDRRREQECVSPLTNPSISAPQEHQYYSSLGGLPRDILPLYSHVFIFCKILLKKKNHLDFPGGPVFQGKWFQSLVWKDSICQSNSACTPQLLKPARSRACVSRPLSPRSKVRAWHREKSPLAAARESLRAATSPA